MSDRADVLARQLVEKTENGKLTWTMVSDASPEPYAVFERYRAQLDDGFSFSISRKIIGDNKFLDFELSQPEEGVVLSEQANNIPNPELERIWEQAREIRPSGAKPLGPNNIERFRLFSDLFYVAKESAMHDKQTVDKVRTIEKVQQLLERLG